MAGRLRDHGERSDASLSSLRSGLPRAGVGCGRPGVGEFENVLKRPW
jgi:hypothetical protein